MSDKPAVVRVKNITVARGFKCKYCGVIRPYDRPQCFCKESKNAVNRNQG